MSKNMLGDALREYTGLRHQLDENLLGENGQEWSVQLKRFLRKEVCWSNGQATSVAQPKPMPTVLELVSTVTVPATTDKFVARKQFVVNTGRKAKVKISYLGDNFIAWFMDGKGQTEGPIGKQTLRYHTLRQSSRDAPIIAELGGEGKSETTLSETFSLMKKQKNGQDGVLLNNGYANIFYIRDRNGVLRAVFVYWYDGGWYVFAYTVDYPDPWLGGYRVFSRNSGNPLVA